MRAFFALWPDAQTRARLAHAAAFLRLGSEARPVPAENFHLTLAFVGEVSPPQFAVLQHIARAQRGLTFTIRLDAYEYWEGPQLVVAVARQTPAALIELARKLRAALDTRQSEPPLRAHVTLARKVMQAPVPQAMSALSWSAKSFSLVRSDTSGARSVYTVVDTWRLLDETPAT